MGRERVGNFHEAPRSVRRLAPAIGLALLALAAPAHALDKITVGSTVSITDLSFFIADHRGYFKDEGLDVQFVDFDSAARMIAPLASGELDVASGGPSASLYNAIARGIGVRIVADKTSTAPGRHSQSLLVRTPLMDSGRVKTLADLKGLRVANAAPGSSSMGTLDRIYKQTGLKSTDIDRVYMGFPQQVLALQGGSVDAAFPTEPFASAALRDGYARQLTTDDVIYPYHEIAVIIFSDAFRLQRRDVATRFLRAYLRGVRAQNAAIANGSLSGPGAEEFVDLVAQRTSIKDRAMLRSLNLSTTDPDGKLNVDSLREDYEVFKKEGLIEGAVGVDRAVDQSLARDAAASLAGERR